MGNYTLEELSAATIVAANTLTLKPGQEQFVAPTSYALAESYFNPATEWPRVVIEDGKVVGFIRGHFDPESDQPEFKSCIWRITVAADKQGKGIGRFAIQALAAEAKSRGFSTLTVLWEGGDAGPGEFFRRIGFTEIGTSRFGEVIGELAL
jgi:diamine N-acetyltransferase